MIEIQFHARTAPLTAPLGQTPSRVRNLVRGTQHNFVANRRNKSPQTRLQHVLNPASGNDCLQGKAAPQENIDETRNIGYIDAESVRTL